MKRTIWLKRAAIGMVLVGPASVGVMLIIAAVASSAWAQGTQEPSQQESSQQESSIPSRRLLRAKAFEALSLGDNRAAAQAADSLVKHHPDDALAVRTAADVYLRVGDSKTAVKLFDQYVKQHPDDLPYLWQRGIALYFVGDYQEGAKQFEVHRTVNPNDVENAAWHFLCVAKAKSFQEARRLVLPAPGDSRIPMDEVLAMLSNGDTRRSEE
ncbi:MAG: tetratricopeptide repeat protein, partial [Pirellulales bacterium]|nr:tetratricopeptide repeat protein [Pirellulales bacterium]